MEDIKNIESAKARGETFRKSIANKRRNKKYSPNFLEMTIAFLNKTPKEAGLFDASPKSVKGRAAAKKKKAEPKGMSDRKSAPKKSVRNGEKDIRDQGKKYNVGVSKGGVPFKEAFAHFRKKGAKTFEWNGKKYTTELASEKKKKMSSGGALKKPDNPGLAKLPTNVRNRMGYMNKGGVAKKK